ncbi:MAG: hypothetical protein Q8L66_12565 [Caulobacter sp.]|nr:hypothetical protein [Caulobacter sp.]
MLKKLALAGALVIAMLAPAAAQAQSGMLSDWGVDDMRQALVAAGAKVTKNGAFTDGSPYLSAETAKGLKFIVYGTVCSGDAAKRCKGANMSASFTLASDAAVDARVKEIDRSAVSVRNGGDKSLSVSRYLIFDDGVARGNLKMNIVVFMNIAEEIWGGGGAAD